MTAPICKGMKRPDCHFLPSTQPPQLRWLDLLPGCGYCPPYQQELYCYTLHFTLLHLGHKVIRWNRRRFGGRHNHEIGGPKRRAGTFEVARRRPSLLRRVMMAHQFTFTTRSCRILTLNLLMCFNHNWERYGRHFLKSWTGARLWLTRAINFLDKLYGPMTIGTSGTREYAFHI